MGAGRLPTFRFSPARERLWSRRAPNRRMDRPAHGPEATAAQTRSNRNERPDEVGRPCMAAMDQQPVDGSPADIAAAESAVIGIIFVEAHAERTSFEQLCEINTSFATAILMIFWGVEMLDADTQLTTHSTNFEAVTVAKADTERRCEWQK